MPDIRRPYPWLILCLIVQAVLMTNRLDLPRRAAAYKCDAPDSQLKEASARLHVWYLALWIFSACVLLYSCMARSYSLQVLAFIVVCWWAWRWREEFVSWKRLTPSANRPILLAIAKGAQSSPRAGTVIAGALLAANLVGIGSYFQARDLLNIGHLAPRDRITGYRRQFLPGRNARAGGGPNLSGAVLEYCRIFSGGRFLSGRTPKMRAGQSPVLRSGIFGFCAILAMSPRPTRR
jgi:hypothetical protein